MMSRHHTEVATELNSVQWTMRSRHHTEVATKDEQLKEVLCRDINIESEAVAIAACKEIKVATSPPEERRS